MSLEIPETRREEEALRHHEEQKAEHRDLRHENELHPTDNRAYHEMKEAKEVEDARIGEREKADRRHEDEVDASIKETVNTELRDEGR